MDLANALAKAGQVLVDERRAPTISYREKQSKGISQSQTVVQMLGGRSGSNSLVILLEQRNASSRVVLESPDRFELQGTNVELLSRIFSQVNDSDKAHFIAAIGEDVKLIAGQEYARLFRNVVIEYGLLFLATLKKRLVVLK